MTCDLSVLKAAHLNATRHRAEVECSDLCGCFYCLATFQPAEIEEWLDEGDGTATCPKCAIDSVIGSASGYPIDDPMFLKDMHRYWFSASS